jgi:UDP-GlcNAc:undecaprenyl-phosphate/decaprenyl-phosphate GlcNAc-1-phosphate transferase
MSENASVAAAAFVVAVVATPLAARFATRVGLVDRPGPLKPHAQATPYLGGVGLACGAAIGVAVLDSWLLVPLGMALALGTADDVRPLPPVVRLIGEVAIGLVLAAVVSTRFGGAGYLLVPAACVALVNGFNLLDGLDALCGAVALIGAGGFALLLEGDRRGFAVALTCATAAFLLFNRPPAKVFLGDGGTYFLGVAFVALLVSAWAPRAAGATGVGSLALVALPVAEIVLALIRRARSGRSVFSGDRNHPYDVLVRSGWSLRRTVGVYALAELCALLLAVLASHLRVQVAWIVVSVTVCGFLAAGLGAGGSPYSKRVDKLST